MSANKGAVISLSKNMHEGREIACVLKVQDIPVPTPKANQVVVQMKAVGICGSDVHYWTHGSIGDFIMTRPMVVGHECAGVVHSVGAEVTSLKVGDRVAVEPGIPCRQCVLCKSGRYNLCKDMAFFATPPIDGALATYAAHDADFCFKLPDNVSFEQGALCEPLSVGVHASKRGGVTLGSSVIIFGAGPIGIVCALAAKAYGAGRIVVVDLDEQRIAFARSIAAVTEAAQVPRGAPATDARKDFIASFDVAFECSGADDAMAASILSVKPGGAVVLIGCGAPVAKVPLLNAAVREVDVRGIFRYANTYPAAIALIASGVVDVMPLITHRVPFTTTEVVTEAFTSAWKGKDRDGKMAVKVMFGFE